MVLVYHLRGHHLQGFTLYYHFSIKIKIEFSVIIFDWKWLLKMKFLIIEYFALNLIAIGNDKYFDD